MQSSKVTKALFCSFICAGVALAQTHAKVDFSRDVFPIFRQNCVPCHGPSQQNSGMRLDRKSSVISRRGVVPGSAENSFLFHRVSGTAYGAQMPPTGPLRAEQINTIKTWIDQGADWPEALANEADAPPPNPKAVAMVEALRTGDMAAFNKLLAGDPKLLNARGPEGSTPFMYAVLYTATPVLQQLLNKGADPNRTNDAGATALIWGATDLEKARILVNHDANVNARSADLRTPLMIAADRATRPQSSCCSNMAPIPTPTTGPTSRARRSSMPQRPVILPAWSCCSRKAPTQSAPARTCLKCL